MGFYYVRENNRLYVLRIGQSFEQIKYYPGYSSYGITEYTKLSARVLLLANKAFKTKDENNDDIYINKQSCIKYINRVLRIKIDEINRLRQRMIRRNFIWRVANKDRIRLKRVKNLVTECLNLRTKTTNDHFPICTNIAEIVEMTTVKFFGYPLIPIP